MKVNQLQTVKRMWFFISQPWQGNSYWSHSTRLLHRTRFLSCITNTSHFHVEHRCSICIIHIVALVDGCLKHDIISTWQIKSHVLSPLLIMSFPVRSKLIKTLKTQSTHKLSKRTGDTRISGRQRNSRQFILTPGRAFISQHSCLLLFMHLHLVATQKRFSRAISSRSSRVVGIEEEIKMCVGSVSVSIMNTKKITMLPYLPESILRYYLNPKANQKGY